MLFNSPEFVFSVYSQRFSCLLASRARRSNCLLRFCVSHCVVVFYGYWRSVNLALLLAFIGGNYQIARLIFSGQGTPVKRWLLILGVIFNLVLLGYFKYAVFMVENSALAFGEPWSIKPVVLPLAISFFTLQKIAYLVGCNENEVVPPPFFFKTCCSSLSSPN